MDTLSGVGVLDKAVSVLGALRRSSCTLADLQDATGLPRATAHRLAVALEVHGLVRRDESGRFALGFGLIELGRAAATGFALAEVARPVLEQLRDRTAEGVQLYVREGEHHRRCVLSLPAPHGLQWIVPEGVLLPLERGSAGRVLVGHDSASTRQWAESVEEREKGVASVSAAVRSAGGRVVAAVSVSGPLERLTRSPGRRFGPLVFDAAADLSRRLTA
jgi:DNA-binding IclR family transcriptional regulator